LNNFAAGEESTKCGLRNEYANIRHYWSTDLEDHKDIGSVMVRCTIANYYGKGLYCVTVLGFIHDVDKNILLLFLQND